MNYRYWYFYYWTGELWLPPLFLSLPVKQRWGFGRIRLRDPDIFTTSSGSDTGRLYSLKKKACSKFNKKISYRSFSWIAMMCIDNCSPLVRVSHNDCGSEDWKEFPGLRLRTFKMGLPQFCKFLLKPFIKISRKYWENKHFLRKLSTLTLYVLLQSCKSSGLLKKSAFGNFSCVASFL